MEARDPATAVGDVPDDLLEEGQVVWRGRETHGAAHEECGHPGRCRDRRQPNEAGRDRPAPEPRVHPAPDQPAAGAACPLGTGQEWLPRRAIAIRDPPRRGLDGLGSGQPRLPAKGPQRRGLELDIGRVTRPAAATGAAARVRQLDRRGRESQGLDHDRGHALDGDGPLGPDVQDRHRGPRRRRNSAPDPGDQVVHGDVGLRLGAVAQHLEAGRVPQELDHEVMDHAMVRSRADRVAEAERVRPPAVQACEARDQRLAGKLRGRVVRLRQQRAVAFPGRDPGRAAVNDPGGGEPDLVNPDRVHRLAHEFGAHDAAREVPLGVVEAPGDVCSRCEVDHATVAGHGVPERVAVRDVAADKVQERVSVEPGRPVRLRGREVVEDGDGCPVTQQRCDHLAADEPGAAGDEGPDRLQAVRHPGHRRRASASRASRPCQRPARKTARHRSGTHSTEYS